MQQKKRINFVREDRVFTYVLDSELKILPPYNMNIWELFIIIIDQLFKYLLIKKETCCQENIV